MKKIAISLLCMCISTMAFAYKITNSAASSIPIKVAVIKKDWRGRAQTPIAANVNAEHMLAPGKSGAWNQGEIRKKIKSEKVDVWVYRKGDLYGRKGKGPIFTIEDMPINAALEILVDGDLNGQVVGGAVNRATGKRYNLVDLDKAVKMIKKYRKEQAPLVSNILPS